GCTQFGGATTHQPSQGGVPREAWNPCFKRVGAELFDATAGFLCCPGGERDAAQHGPSHPGTKDCRHHSNHVEERSEFRPPTVAATSSLSIAEEEPSIPRVPSASGRSVSRDARFEGSISQ